MNLTIRPTTIDDAQTIVDLFKAQARFENKKPEEIKVTLEQIQQFGFGSDVYFQTLIAEKEGKAIGLAMYYFAFSSYIGQPVLHLEELFVLDEHRSEGVGKALMLELARIAKSKSCCRIQWLTFDWNKHAISFYKKLGAEFKLELSYMRWQSNKFKTALKTS